MNNNGLLFDNNSTRLNQMVTSQLDRSMNKSMRSAKPGESSPKDASKTSKDISKIVNQLMLEEE